MRLWSRGLLWAAIATVLLVAVLAGMVFYFIGAGKEEVQFTQESARESVQSLRLQSPQGLFELGDLRGKIVLVDVWATWCGPCLRAIPELVSLQERYQEDLTIIGLSVDEEGWDAIEPFLKKHSEINYTIATRHPEPTLQVGTVVNLEPLGRVSVLPTSFLIDREGRLVSKYVGPEMQKIEADLQQLLQETAGVS
ncbi:MAG: TlpA family protein disulfide reductase [Acidobacteriota bacterium]